MADREKQRPGILIYYDKVEAIRCIPTLEDKGRFIDAVFDYGQYGVVPDFSNNPILNVVWKIVQPCIDRDAEAYQKKVERTTIAGLYSAYTLRCKADNTEPETFEIWKLRRETGDNSSQQMLSDDNKRRPTTATTPTTASKTKSDTTTTTKTTPTSATTSDRTARTLTDELKENYTATTPDDFQRLKDEAIAKLSRQR